ncbi:MAG: hypothetical protein ABH861_02025 [Patescibacteria group bacterium]|nr:hypothetical protein [Patescibacteria group bacterium]
MIAGGAAIDVPALAASILAFYAGDEDYEALRLAGGIDFEIDSARRRIGRVEQREH